MPSSVSCRIRQRKPYRTRLNCPALRGREQRCRLLQELLTALPGAEHVEVRPLTGSVIVHHPRRMPALRELTGAVAQAVAASGDPVVRGPRPAEAPASDRPRHVSGAMLVCSGLYLLYLFIRRVTIPIVAPVTLLGRLFSLPVVVTLALAVPIQRQAVDNLRRTGRPDMSLISVILLYGSLYTGRVLPVLTVFWLFNLSGWIETRIQSRTRRAVREMLRGVDSTVWLVRDGGEIEVETASLVPGDVVSLRMGNTVPVDGQVVSGRALFDESSLTGEDELVGHGPGDSVLAGTVLLSGAVRVRVERTGAATRQAAIVALIEQAENQPCALQTASQRWSRRLAPVFLTLAGFCLVTTGNPVLAMAVLIIACPCALRLSASVAMSAVMSGAAARGVLVKSGQAMELAGRVNVVAFDKTGTLIGRTPEVVEVRVLDRRYREETVLRLAASAQQGWNHPLSRAVIARAEEAGLSVMPGESQELVTGQGVRARVEGRLVLVGHRDFMAENGVGMDKADIVFPECGGSALYVACDDRLISVLRLGSVVDDEVGPALARLRRLGVRHIVLLTGDRHDGGLAAGKIGIDEVVSGLSPEEKAGWITGWKRAHPQDVVAMVGDGINDLPAFAVADLGVAVHGGVDVAVEYADVVVQRDSVGRSATLLELGRNGLQRLRESSTLAIAGNATLLAATVLGFLSPVAGAVFHNLLTVAAVVHAGGAGRLPEKAEKAGQGQPVPVVREKP
ncbi:MAG: heavy metal translocating P-type ATPase [Desulfobulbus sp.]|jgi:cation-transporting P-type ATPase C